MMEEEHLMKTETHRCETCHKLGNNSPHTWQTEEGVVACVVYVHNSGKESLLGMEVIVTINDLYTQLEIRKELSQTNKTY